MNNAHRTFSIHVHIATVIILLVVMVSGVQIWLGNRWLTDVFFETNKNVFQRIADQTRSQMTVHYGATFIAIGTFQKGKMVQSKTIEKEIVSRAFANAMKIR